MNKKFRYGEPIEYKMSQAMADFYLDGRKGDDKKMNPEKL